MSKLVEYKKELSDTDRLEIKAKLTSSLFESMVQENQSDDKWVADYETIFEILHRNYENPKAMNCFIFYDIENNKLRVQLAKYFLRKGAQRIQKSVYLANISKKIYNEIFETLIELEQVLGERDSIFLVPIGEYHLAEMQMVGREVDMSFSRSNQHVIFV
jgi:CRISPR-associated endonuclease Cas2